MSRTLVIVPCGLRKAWDADPQRGPTPAREAYSGAPFRANRAYAERCGDDWVILSAKYGFISPDFSIPGPYNVTFKQAKTNPVPMATLRDQIRDQRLDEFARIIGLGGKDYRIAIQQAFATFGVVVHFPFAGLPIGRAMQAVKCAGINSAVADRELSMTIRFPKRSSFVEALRLGVKERRSSLDQGRAIELQLEPGGYGGRWFIVVRPEDSLEFEVIGSLKDPSRFGQRFRVAAWALYQEEAFGRFEIAHDRTSGIVTIKRDD